MTAPAQSMALRAKIRGALDAYLASYAVPGNAPLHETVEDAFWGGFSAALKIVASEHGIDIAMFAQEQIDDR